MRVQQIVTYKTEELALWVGKKCLFICFRVCNIEDHAYMDYKKLSQTRLKPNKIHFEVT